MRPIAWLPGAMYWPLDAFTASLVPAPVRAALGLPWGPAERRWARFVILALRLLVPRLPDRVRRVPQARGIGLR